MKIDVHTHIIPENYPDLQERYGYGGFVKLEHHKQCCAKMMIDNKFFREIESNCWDAKVRMHECDTFEVSHQVLSTIPVMFSYWAKPKDTWDLSQILNDHIAGIIDDYTDRFLGLGTIPMQDTSLAIKELERIKSIGLQGIQIGSNINQKNLNEDVFFPIFEAASDLGLSVFVHPWDMMGKNEMTKYWLPWLVGMPAESSRAICSMIFGGVFERLPNLKVCFAHGGGSFPSTIGRISHGFESRPDLCAVDNPIHPKEYLGKFYLDSLVHDKATLQFLVDLIGAEKIMIGSDYPFPLGESVPGLLVKESQLSEEQKDWINYKSALEWLSLSDKYK